jgi:hypothetical protein
LPKIPTAEAGYPQLEKPSAEAIGVASRYIHQATGNLAQAAGGLADTIGNTVEKVQNAQDALDAVTFENNLKEKVDTIAESYKGRLDYENFGKDLEKDINSLGDLAPKSASPRLNVAVQRAIGNQGNTLRDMITNKKYTVMEGLGKVEALRLEDTNIEKYGLASTDEERNLIKTQNELQMRTIQKSNLVNPLWVEERLLNWEDKAKKQLISNEDAIADQAIRIDAKGTFQRLNEDKTYLPHLPVKVREDKLDRAMRQIRQNDEDKRREEADAERDKKRKQEDMETTIALRQVQGFPVNDLIENGVASGTVDAGIIHRSMSFQNSLNNSVSDDDPDTKNKFVRGLYGPILTTSQQDLDNALINKKLSSKTYQEFTAHRFTRTEEIRKEFKSDQQKSVDRTFSHGEKALGLSFTMEGPGSAIIDREAKTLHADALREYYGLVYDPKNPMDADEALDKVQNRYLKTLDGIKDRESKKIRNSLVIPNKETSSVRDMGIWLSNNESTMPKATFDANVRLLRSIEFLESVQRKVPETTTKEKKKYGVTR